MQDNVLDVLVTKFTADLQPLEAGLTQAARESQQAGLKIGQGLQAGIGRTSLSDDGVKLGQGLTAGITQGLRQGERQIDAQLSQMTEKARVSGGGFGGAISAGLGQGLAPALGNLGGLTAGLGNVTGAMGGAAAAAGPLAAGVAGVTAAVGASVTAVNAAINSYATYANKMAQISTLTDKMPGQLNVMGDRLREISSTYGKAIGDIQGAMMEVLGAGVRGTESQGEALRLVEVAAKAAVASSTDAASVADGLTSVLNAYKLSAAEAGRVSDLLFKTIDEGKVSMAELSGSLGMILPQANDLKIPLQEVLGAVAYLTQQGMSGSQAIEYLRSALSNIQKPSDEAQKIAKRLGFEFSAQAVQAKGLVGVLEDVNRGVKGNSTVMAQLFGDVGALQAATALTSNELRDFKKVIGEVADASGATERAYGKFADDIKKKTDQLASTWENFKGRIGELFAPMKSAGLDTLNTLLNKADELLNKFIRIRDLQGAQYDVEELRRGIDSTQANITRTRGVIADPNASEFARGRAEYELKGYVKTLEILEARLKIAQADMKQATSDYVATSDAVLPKGVQGPNMGGSGGAVTPVQVVTGRDLVTLLGMGGRTVLNEFGVSGKDYHHDGAVSANATHNGIDYGATRGSAILAPFTGELSVREDAKNGKIFELVDQAGNKIVGIHLDSFDKAVLAALNAGGGKAIIGQGTRIGGVGNTGTTAGSAPHLHLMGYAASNSRPIDPTSIKFQGMSSAEYGVDGSNPTPTGGTPPPGAPNKDDLKAYSLNLADWNKNQARALELAREAAKAESDLTGKRGLQVKAAMEKWAGEDKARQQSYQLAVQLTARQEQAAAKSKAEQERAAAEAKRDQEKAAQEAERREKEAQQRAARINEALRQGKIESARNELNRLQQMRENDLRNAGDNAQRVAQVEQRYAALTYNAKAAIALKEKQDRDADIKNDTSLNGTARAQALKNSNQTYLNALKAAGNERRAALDGVNKDLEASAARNAAVMPGLMSGWIDDWAQDQSKDRDAAAAGAAVVTKLFDGAIDQLGKSRAEMEAALTDALNDIYQKAIDAGIDPFSGGSPDQFRDMTTPGRSGLAALIGGNPAGFLKAFTATGGTPDALLAEFADADWESLGLDVLQGLADGMRSDAAWDGVRGVVEGALGRILAESAFAADVAALVSDRDGTLGAPAGIMTGNERPEGESTPLAQSIALRKAVDDYAASLRDMREDQLAAAEAEAIAADNADFYNAVLAERARRLQEQKDKAEAAAKAERELADAIAKKQADAITQATQDTAEYNAAQDALAKSSRELGAAMGQTEAPYQNQIDSLEELRAKIVAGGGATDAVDALIAKWKELQGTMQVADIAGQIAGAVSQIGALFDKVNGSEGKGALSILGDWMQMNVTAYKQFQSGDVVGAVMTTINGVLNIGESIAELNSGLKEWKKNLREIAEEQKKVLGMSTGGFKSPWEEALKKDAGNREQLANSKWYQRLWWGLTGGGPQAISDEAAKLLTDLQEIFAQLGDGIADAFTDAMLSAFEAGDMSQFADNFSKQFDAVVGKVVLKTMIEAALTQGAVADDLAALTKAIQEQRYGDVPPILASIKQKAGQIGAGIAAVAPSLPGYGGGSDGSGADNRALFGNAPTTQLGIPRFEVTLPDTVMKPLGDFAAVIPAFSRATDRLYEAADMIVRSGWGLQNLTPNTTMRR